MENELLKKLNKIDDTFSVTTSEAECLSSFSHISSEYGAVIEIGTLRGRSAIAMASKTDKNVYCIDTWRDEKIYNEFLENTSEYKNIIPIIGTVSDFKEKEKIGMIFIDGSHDYESVKKDMEFAVNINPQIIALHDYLSKEDPIVTIVAIEIMGRLCDVVEGLLGIYEKK